MRFRVRKRGARERAKRLWHSWFAWRPVRVPTHGSMKGMSVVWLETVERKARIINKYWRGGPFPDLQMDFYEGFIYRFKDGDREAGIMVVRAETGPGRH